MGVQVIQKLNTQMRRNLIQAYMNAAEHKLLPDGLE